VESRSVVRQIYSLIHAIKPKIISGCADDGGLFVNWSFYWQSAADAICTKANADTAATAAFEKWRMKRPPSCLSRLQERNQDAH
jgi:hypothetical protein